MFVAEPVQISWLEVFYREAKGSSGLKEYQVRLNEVDLENSIRQRKKVLVDDIGRINYPPG